MEKCNPVELLIVRNSEIKHSERPWRKFLLKITRKVRWERELIRGIVMLCNAEYNLYFVCIVTGSLNESENSTCHKITQSNLVSTTSRRRSTFA